MPLRDSLQTTQQREAWATAFIQAFDAVVEAAKEGKATRLYCHCGTAIGREAVLQMLNDHTRTDRCHCAATAQWANLLATRLLLPESRFFSAVQDSQGDLLELKQQFPTASFELISLRLLDRPDPRCVTIIDQGRISKRRSNTEARPGPLLEPEALCWEESHEQAKFSERSSDTLWVRCWPIHEEQWKREIILTQPGENEFA